MGQRTETSKPEILIALLGVTGAGKTTFARLVSGDTSLKVGHSIHSCTQEPEVVRFKFSGYPIVLIDTPGFDDDSRSDVEILEELAAWMAQHGHLKHKQLDGLILLHPITVLRAGGAERKRTRLLKNILGPQAYKHIVIATTMHEHLNSEADINERVDGRRQELWGDMVNQGTKLVQHFNNKESADNIIDMIIQISKKLGKLRSLLQDELARDPRLIETTAGKDVKKQLEEEIRKVTTQLEQNRGKRPRKPLKRDKSQAGITARRAWRDWRDDQKELEEKLAMLQFRLKRLNSLSY
ncbi:GTPase IMAP family member 4 [Madurella mycetomatis]|uniref:GTPase IMAP family member 4 n=1 Tax=Madurella mycetomatis TaxID=100816 RepID=A0A175W7Z9_9PEZI|nr:GTPase IMAP family member 4 [Madurella mycetomatis]